MSATGTAERELETRAELFKALGHPTRLLLVNLIAAAPRHTEELADIVALSPGTVSHHIGLLVKAGLLTSRRETTVQAPAESRRLTPSSAANHVEPSGPTATSSWPLESSPSSAVNTVGRPLRMSH